MRRWETINTSGGGEQLKLRLNNLEAEYKGRSPKVEAILTPIPGQQMVVFTYEPQPSGPQNPSRSGEPKL